MIRVIRSIGQMKDLSLRIKKAGKTIGFVPTMGYLHDGHISLVSMARQACDIVVVSIFVNPKQFGPGEDLKKYPRDFSRDKKLLMKAKADIIFYPAVKEMYPDGYRTNVYVSDLSGKLCGASRPGHFNGVTTIVAKLFNIVKPDTAYFGQKDFQQQVIIKKMARDLNMGVKISALPTIRERDGLAMSSRNAYLSKVERKNAPVIYRSLKFANQLIKSGVKSSTAIRSAITKLIKSKPGFKIDYIAVSDPETLEDKKTINGRTLVAVAVYLGKTRLIDNIVVR